MQIRSILFASFILFLCACEEDKEPCGLPVCMEAVIDSFDPVCPETGTIEEYIFQNQVVYVLNNAACCCDHFSFVLNTDCDTIGLLGGIAGLYEINGESFDTAILQDTIWP